MRFPPEVQSCLLTSLRVLYGDRAEECLQWLLALADRHEQVRRQRPCRLWDERDVVLIAYGDQIQSAGRSGLAALEEFLLEHHLSSLITAVHVLPFFPYSSDDGFSVIDYRQVAPAVGSWEDVGRLAGSFGLMVDLVLNHCSTQHHWFREYLAGEARYADYFIEADPAADLSSVTRPRSAPLLTAFETSRGIRHLWTTFSDDQVDLNWSNPDVLLEMMDLLLFYASQGARIIRLDAIAYLWKRVGTPCVHLPETHAAVKLMRAFLDAVAPGTLLLTETNLPHGENVAYFGDGDEAHLVYPFSLPPLLLDAFLTGDARTLRQWLSDLAPTRPGTSYLNFTASHDGIGLRPLEGLLSAKQTRVLVDAARARGGLVGSRRNPDGSESVYELNISYFSALDEPGGSPAEAHARRFLASQAIMLSLRGIPAIYFHSLVGTPNDLEGVRRTGRARSINRRRFERDELATILARPASAERLVLDDYRTMLTVRTRQPAFHPDASQEVLDLENPAILALVRTSLDERQRILAVVNVSRTTAVVRLPARFEQKRVRQLLGVAARWKGKDRWSLLPGGVLWLSKEEHS
ncbi:MAG: alpha-amylase family glycosyl hydrolase [Pirellulales bacterium]